MLLIFVSSSVPGATVNAVGLGKESYHINAHLFMFFSLVFTYYKATQSVKDSVLLGLGYAFFDELHQTFTPERSTSFFDIYIDTVGILLAGFILWKLQHILPKKLRNWLTE
jgi:VanZ family protein